MSREGKIVFVGVVIVVTLVSLILYISPATEHPPRLAYIGTNDWPPFIGRQLPDQGPLTHLVRTTLLAAGYDAKFVFYPTWEEALEDAKANKIAAVFPLIETEERTKIYSLSKPLCEFEYGFHYKKSAFRRDHKDPGAVGSKEDLKKYRIATLKGYMFWEEMSDLKVFKSYDSIDQAFQGLHNNEIDFVAEGRVAGRHILYSPQNALDQTHYGFLELGEKRHQHLHLLTTRDELRSAFSGKLPEAILEFGLRYDEKNVPNCKAYLPSINEEQWPLVAGSFNDAIPAQDPGSDEGGWGLLPRGTKAVSVEWNETYLDTTVAKDTLLLSGLCHVKVLNGPLRGRVLKVKCSDIFLSTDGQQRHDAN